MAVAAGPSILRLASGPQAGKVFEVGSTLRVGRHPFNELSLADPGLSRYHCWIMVKDGAPCVEDLASANGTFVNGERIRARRALRAGDVIRVGSTEIVVTEAA
jgi:pSer/pThr/pTyr-binding forkhead associated (FHA) protein